MEIVIKVLLMALYIYQLVATVIVTTIALALLIQGGTLQLKLYDK